MEYVAAYSYVYTQKCSGCKPLCLNTFTLLKKFLYYGKKYKFYICITFSTRNLCQLIFLCETEIDQPTFRYPFRKEAVSEESFSIYLHIYLSIYHKYVYQCMNVNPEYIYLIYMYIYPSTNLSLSIYLFLYLSIFLSIYFSIYLSSF